MEQTKLNRAETSTLSNVGDGGSTPIPVISVSPVVLSAPGRRVELQVRVSAPVTGSHLPIIVFAHGFGSSMDGYAPLVNFWVAHGFVVIQPTFLDSKTLSPNPAAKHSEALATYLADPHSASIWRVRVEDMKHILDQLDVIEAVVPGLTGRLDRSRIAAVGHSFGGHTVSMLLGSRVIGTDGSLDEDMSDPRIKVGVLLCASGRGGEDLSPFAAEHLSYLNQNYTGLTTPTLVVAGDQDYSQLTVRGPEWFTDAYTLSPGADWLVTLFGGEHMLGGISGYQVTETTDENLDRVAAVQRLTWAYLRSALYSEDPAWIVACKELQTNPNPQGRVDGK